MQITDISQFQQHELEVAIEQLQRLIKIINQSKIGLYNIFPQQEEISLCINEKSDEVGFTDGINFYQISEEGYPLIKDNF